MDTEKQIPDVTIDQLPLRLREAAARIGWKTLMPVQARAIPHLLTGRGVLIQARMRLLPVARTSWQSAGNPLDAQARRLGSPAFLE